MNMFGDRQSAERIRTQDLRKVNLPGKANEKTIENGRVSGRFIVTWRL